MPRSLKGTNESLPIFNFSWKTGKEWDLQKLSYYPEKDITENKKLTILPIVSDT